MNDVKAWRRLFSRDERLDELERQANELIIDIREQSALTTKAAKELQIVVKAEQQRRRNK